MPFHSFFFKFVLNIQFVACQLNLILTGLELKEKINVFFIGGSKSSLQPTGIRLRYKPGVGLAGLSRSRGA